MRLQALALVVGVAVMGGACGDGSGPPAPAPTSTSTSTSVVPDRTSLLALRPVLAVDSPPCHDDAMPLQGEEACVWLGPVAVDGDAVAWASVEPHTDLSGTRPVLQLHLTGDGQERMDALATAQLHKQIGIVVDGALVSTPVVQASTFGGEVSVVGLTDAQAARVVAAFPRPPGS